MLYIIRYFILFFVPDKFLVAGDLQDLSRAFAGTDYKLQVLADALLLLFGKSQ